jgi:hypothetical protein
MTIVVLLTGCKTQDVLLGLLFIMLLLVFIMLLLMFDVHHVVFPSMVHTTLAFALFYKLEFHWI